MTTTTNMAITLLEASQAQKEVTVNEAFVRIDAILNNGAIDKDLSTPPTSPLEGDIYIVANSAIGDWVGQDNNIAYFEQLWRFITPNEGITLWISDEDKLYSFDGSSWVLTTDDVSFQNQPLVGVNTTADGTNKLAVSSDAVLFNHNGSDTQVKLNKNSSSDTSSFVFQTNWSGRAEFGTIGNDDFALKTSSDGTVFNTSFTVDNSNARLTFNSFISFGAAEAVIISGGEITITKSYISVDTEASAATDDLEVINGGEDGDILIIKLTNNARYVTLKDYGSSTPGSNMDLSSDFLLDRDRDRVMLQKDGIRWRQISESSN